MLLDLSVFAFYPQGSQKCAITRIRGLDRNEFEYTIQYNGCFVRYKRLKTPEKYQSYSFAFAAPTSDPDSVAPAAAKTVAPRSFTFVVKMTLPPSFHISVTSVSPG